MAHLNNIHNTEGYKIISGFENSFVCDKAIEANKTITFPDGWDNDTNLSFKVLFKNGHNCVDASTPMTLNGVEVVVNKYGTLIPLPIHEMDDSGTTKYKSLQANTILEMYYTDNYDGSDTPAYVVIGNPIVLSSTDYTIYADAQREQLSYSTDEVWTGKYWIDGKKIYSRVIDNLSIYISSSNWYTILTDSTIDTVIRGISINHISDSFITVSGNVEHVVTSGKINFYFPTFLYSTVTKAIIEYTKITD